MGGRPAGKTLPDLILLDLMMPVMDGTAFRAEQTIDRTLPAVSAPAPKPAQRTERP